MRCDTNLGARTPGLHDDVSESSITPASGQVGTHPCCASVDA